MSRGKYTGEEATLGEGRWAWKRPAECAGVYSEGPGRPSFSPVSGVLSTLDGDVVLHPRDTAPEPRLLAQSDAGEAQLENSPPCTGHLPPGSPKLLHDWGSAGHGLGPCMTVSRLQAPPQHGHVGEGRAVSSTAPDCLG